MTFIPDPSCLQDGVYLACVVPKSYYGTCLLPPNEVFSLDCVPEPPAPGVRWEAHIYPDDDITDPEMTWSDESGKVVQFFIGAGCRYNFWTPRRYKYRFFESAEALRDLFEISENKEGEFSKAEVREANRKLEPYWTFLIYKYEHSGVMLQRGRSCRWDSGPIGWVVIDIKAFKKEFNGTILKTEQDGKTVETKLHCRSKNDLWYERADQVVDSEVKIANLYLSGSAYGYKLHKLAPVALCAIPYRWGISRVVPDGPWEVVDLEHGETDSCWGFIYEDEKEMHEAMSDHWPSEAREAFKAGLVPFIEHFRT